MVKTILNTIILILLVSMFNACSSLKVSRDYDTSFDMSRLKTFYLISNSEKLRDTLTINRLNKAIKNELKLKGYEETAREGADFLVYYHIDIKNKTQVVTDYQSIGMYPYRYRGMMVPTTRTYNYDEGQLIIDMINPENSNIIYRLSAKDQLKSLDTPQQRSKYINKVIKEILKDFPKRVK